MFKTNDNFVKQINYRPTNFKKTPPSYYNNSIIVYKLLLCNNIYIIYKLKCNFDNFYVCKRIKNFKIRYTEKFLEIKLKKNIAN